MKCNNKFKNGLHIELWLSVKTWASNFYKMDLLHEMDIDKLKSSENYQVWKFKIKIMFNSLELDDVIVSTPPDATAAEKDKADWKKKDAKAQRIIICTIDKTPTMHIINCNTAKEMIDKLKLIYERDTENQKYNLLQEFFNLKYDKNDNVSVHISKIENLSFRLNSIDQKIDDDMIMSKILSTLPDEYRYFLAAWESSPKLEKTVTNLTARLLAEESRTRPNLKTDTVAFKITEKKCYKCNSALHLARNCTKTQHFANNFKSETRRCFKCNSSSHLSKQCKIQQNPTKFCKICKKNNHEEKDCYFRHDKVRTSNAVSFLSYKNVDKNEIHEWVVDSGSTSHMSNDDLIMKNLNDVKTEITVAKKDETMHADKIGEIETKTCNLKNVLFVPKLNKNLLSVSSITENGGEVKFTQNHVEISKNGENIITGIKSDNGLYTVKLVKNNVQEVYTATDKENKTITWHKKLGHIGKKNLMKLVNIADGIKISKKDFDVLNEICETCIMAKQVRLPFNNERTKAKRPLEIIHTDICGPLEPVTWNNKWYFVTMIDDFTNFTMVSLITNKSEATEELKNYILMVEAKWNLKVSKIRCDNGGEYVNKNLKSWCEMKGIILNYTIPHSPQMNGKAERFNRTLLDKSRALIKDSKLEKEMWGEAILTSTYLINRSPTENLSVTPAEMWFSKKPNLGNLQLFGCVAYAKNLGYLKKLEDRSIKYIFVGYGLNGYRLWDPIKRKIILSRDVIFGDISTNNFKDTQSKVKEDNKNIYLKKHDNDEIQDFLNDQVENEELVDNAEQLFDGQRPKRTIKMPNKFSDYVMLTYNEVINGTEKEEWNKAIESEKQSLIKNNTWKIVDRKEAGNNKILSNRWVFRVKDNGYYKARLVVRGYEQKEDIDYLDTYSPVVSSSPLRTILALAAQRKDHIMTFDVKTAFLYGKLNEDVFMECPQGMEIQGKILKLEKALYGLRQAPHRWNECLTSFLKQIGLNQLKTEQCIFKTDDNVILGLHVDDGIIIGNNVKKMENLLQLIADKFEIKVNENANNFVGIEIEKNTDCIKLKQSNYCNLILKKFNMVECKSTATPIAAQVKHVEQETLTSKFPYREAVGSLLYLSNKTRPDLAFTVNYESRHAENPNDQDVVNIKRTMRYIKGTINKGIVYKCDNSFIDKLEAFCDSDFAGDESRRSTTGYVIMYGGGPISWCSRRQPIVTTSSTEAEYVAAAECVKELLYLKSLIEELTGKTVEVNLHIDNQSAIKLMKNGIMNHRSKHIDVRYQFIAEKVKQNIININYIKTDDNISDLFTKVLGSGKFTKFINYIVE